MSSIIREMETQGLKIKHIYIQSEEAVDDGSAGQRNTLLRFTLTGIDPGKLAHSVDKISRLGDVLTID
jgi:hypothetical protein